MKRTALRRTGPPARTTELQRGPGPERRTQLRAESDSRRAERPERSVTRLQVITRDRGCAFHLMSAAAGGPIQCTGSPEVHEVTKRSRRPGLDAHLAEDYCVALCSMANQWVENFPAGAEAIGLSIPSWSHLDLAGAIDWAWRHRARRQQALRCALTVPPWREDEELFAARARRDLERAGWSV